VVDKLEKAFSRIGAGQFEKWRVAAMLRDLMLEDSSAIPDEVVARAARLVEALNEAFVTVG
jgi:hypothetical protein